MYTTCNVILNKLLIFEYKLNTKNHQNLVFSLKMFFLYFTSIKLSGYRYSGIFLSVLYKILPEHYTKPIEHRLRTTGLQ